MICPAWNLRSLMVSATSDDGGQGMVNSKALVSMAKEFERLATLPFEDVSVLTWIQDAGWEIDKDGWHYEEGTDFVFVAHASEARYRLVVVNEERMAAFALSVLALDDSNPEPGCVTSWDALRLVYDEARTVLVEVWGAPDRAGEYPHPYESVVLRYTIWHRRKGWFVLLEHDEGDGHLGNDATADVRFIARDDAPSFPLETNLIL